MKYFKPGLLFFTLAFIFQILTTQVVFSEGSASGTIKVDDISAEMNHVYFDNYKEEFTVIVTDNPVDPFASPYGINKLSEQAKVRALKFTLNREKKDIMTNRGKGIFFHPVWDRIINIGEPELKIKTFDENKLEGSIKTTGEYDGHKFSYDISFDLSLKKEVPELLFTGKSGPQVDAYASYCRAIQEGNIEEFKKYVPSENLTYLPKDNKDIILGLEFARDMMMTNMDITDIKTSGDKSDLIIKGSRDSATSNGKVTMLNENGSWKVVEESWKLE